MTGCDREQSRRAVFECLTRGMLDVMDEESRPSHRALKEFLDAEKLRLQKVQ